ncbi:MAG: DUF3800 domain-containing protein [Candidatus Cloacimonas sp.]|jgi:hypothetical protein|nr:DUF3800 domain-containing protein [Candidatus Cloacimonas sp.]
MMNIFFDESGDLGFSDSSSRYLCLAFLQIPDSKRMLTKRIVKGLYRHVLGNLWDKSKPRGGADELKGSTLSLDNKQYFADKVKNLLAKHSDIKLYSIIAYKPNVQEHLRKSPNLLYNYMAGLILPKHVPLSEPLNLHPDNKSIKVGSANSFSDYIEIKLRYEHNVAGDITVCYCNSENDLNIQFVDIITNIVFRHYERGENTVYKILSSSISQTKLYFD